VSMRMFLHIVLAVVLAIPLLASAAVRATVGEILSGKCLDQEVVAEGLVAESFLDPIDPGYQHIFLSDGRAMVDIALPLGRYPTNDPVDPIRLINSRIGICGKCLPKPSGWRTLSKPFVMGSAIDVLSPPEDATHAIASLEMRDQLNVNALRENSRRRIDGRVAACWNDNNLLIVSPNGIKAKVRLAQGIEPPATGTSVRIIGYVDTDAANIILTSATWEPIDAVATGEDAPTVIPEHVFEGGPLCSNYDGCLATIRAVVSNVSDLQYPFPKLIVLVKDHPVAILPGGRDLALDGVEVGSTIEATGIFIVQTEDWSRRSPFPRVTGYSLVVKSSGDVKVLKRPLWWTARRLGAAVGELLAALLAILVWNASLQRLAVRKGRELLHSQLKYLKAELKSEERTRLAIELHDSLSQTLTGVSMEIAAAEDLLYEDPRNMAPHLARAERTLKSCRDELRNCLWDLRNDALDEPDMTLAVRKTLQPHIDGQQVAVRFNVSRARISDNTAHALLRMIRELVMNALRHGQATSVKVAGSLDPHVLRFSVRDNGVGFDPENRPGILQGHFGLQGIQERLEKMGGTLTIRSAPGHGTSVTGAIPRPTPAAGNA